MLILITRMFLQICVEFLRYQHDEVDTEGTVVLTRRSSTRGTAVDAQVRSILFLRAGAETCSIIADREREVAHINRIHLVNVILERGC